MGFEAFIGRSETQEDVLAPAALARMAATLDAPPPGEEAPPLWHWMLFQDWRRPCGIGADGHPRRGGFLPALEDLPRRMWAGGRLSFTGNPLRAGEAVRRVTTILSVTEKTGGSGRLVFVTLRHDLSNPRGAVLREEQDIVYRGTEGAAVREAEPAPPFAAEVRRDLTPDPVLLFRYSALTGNGHRIHYDADYARAEEGYPGLVVHGPLQATLLAATMLAAAPGRRLARFAFRGVRPAFAGAPLALLARREGEGLIGETRDASGATCMKADAALA
ncbi:FAS1-like dehydratase domain-containing protein [Rubritepida flocculans]|uniref:FAS1-like dehydratase domain-containing protein n=1 Tax=Rubritepida flocculans TaxID=182403 RepID=UPI0003F894A8|nr:MaoC family dehydratase N-terminal domain-containing protein [Rubritepida flocculans]